MRSPEGNPDMMSGLQQVTLSNKLTAELRGFANTHKLSPKALLYFLVSFTWGWARACGSSSQQLLNYSSEAYAACDRLNAKAKSG